MGGKPIANDAKNSLDFEELADLADNSITIHQLGSAGEQIVIPGDAWFLRADFDRSGSDLNLIGPDGQKLILRDYFLQEHPPDLTTTDGVVLRGDIAIRLAGPQAPGQYAQAGPVAGKVPIGTIDTASGLVEVVRADGSREKINQGDPLFQGDILETGADGSIGIVFFRKKYSKISYHFRYI